MDDNDNWLFDNLLPYVDSTECEDHLHLQTEGKCDAGFEVQQLDGTHVEAESAVKEEVQVKVEIEDTAFFAQVKGRDSMSLRFSGYDNQSGTNAMHEAGFEGQLHDGTRVKDEVQVRVENEAHGMQSLGLSIPYGSGAGVWKSGSIEGSCEGVLNGMEGEEFKRNLQSKCHLLPHVKMETDVSYGGSLRLAHSEQCMEGEGLCKQEQAVDRPGGWENHMMINPLAGGVFASVFGREDEVKRDIGWKRDVHPQVSMEQCKMEARPVSCEEKDVERLGEEEKQEGEGGVYFQARAESSVAMSGHLSAASAQWSEDSSAPLASRNSKSSSPEGSVPFPCGSSQEMAQLCPSEKGHCSPPRQQQCTKKARVPKYHSVANQEVEVESSPHSHVRTASKDLKRHACPHCDYTCGLRGTLQRHIETAHEGFKRNADPCCQNRASEKGTQQTHTDTADEAKRRYPCPHCQYRAQLKWDIRRHIEAVHEGKRNYPCPLCPYKSSWKSNLQAHIDSNHEGSRKYPCPHCLYRAGRKATLQSHIEEVHEGLKRYACSHCEYRSNRKSSLQRHTNNAHEGLGKYPCPHCPQRVGEKSCLQSHIKSVHEGLKRHACPHCSYRATEEHFLLNHIDIVHLRKHQCPHCEFRAGAAGALQRHIKSTHHGV